MHVDTRRRHANEYGNRRGRKRDFLPYRVCGTPIHLVLLSPTDFYDAVTKMRTIYTGTVVTL